jgi:hypothetical protein
MFVPPLAYGMPICEFASTCQPSTAIKLGANNRRVAEHLRGPATLADKTLRKASHRLADRIAHPSTVTSLTVRQGKRVNTGQAVPHSLSWTSMVNKCL